MLSSFPFIQAVLTAFIIGMYLKETYAPSALPPPLVWLISVLCLLLVWQ